MASTWIEYEAHCRLHIEPFLGRVPVSTLTTRRVKRWLGELEEAGRSSAMRGKVLVSLRAIWSGRSARDTSTPTQPRAPSRRASAEADRAVHARRDRRDPRRHPGSPAPVADGHRADHGPRLGELTGLWLDDIDHELHTISVGHTLSWVTHQAVRTEDPKTDKSNRTIALPESVWRMLEQYLEVRASERAKAIAKGRPYADTPYLFVGRTGQPLRGDGNGGVGPQFKGCLRRAGLRNRNFHQTRHVAASILLSLNGNNIHEVQQILGHSSYKLTLDLYSHLLPEVQAGRAADVDRLLVSLEAQRILREATRQAELDKAAGLDPGAGLLSDPLSAEPAVA